MGAKELSARTFGGRDCNFERMSGYRDIVSRFRDIDSNTENPARDDVINYLATATPLTKEELMDEIAFRAGKARDYDIGKKVKRIGKDLDDIFYSFGKVHGLENMAFLDEETLKATEGNPVKLQDAVNNVKHPGPPATSFDSLVNKALGALEDYKAEVNKLPITRSDRSKLLALPFFAARRTEGPSPQKGQWQYDLFTELTGHDWNEFDKTQLDHERKITEGDYEKFFSPGLLEKLDTESEHFKRTIKLANISTETTYEKHKRLQGEYKNLMNHMAHLNEEEGRALIHLIKSKHRRDYLDSVHGGHLETKLAEISERENFLKKNQYRLQRKKLDHIDKERMPIEKKKIKDLFKNQSAFRRKFDTEIGTYDSLPMNHDFDRRVLNYFYELAYGDLMKLRNEGCMKCVFFSKLGFPK
jgi:hypothetical protein